MAQLLVMYKTPKDTAAFDKHYSEKHIPLAKKIPGIQKIRGQPRSRCNTGWTIWLSSGCDPAV